MLRAPPVLLLVLALCALAAPPGARAQEPDTTAAQRLPQRGFRLEQNYPNPANPDMYIPFYLEESLFRDGEARVVSIRIVNLFRQLVAVPKAVGHPRGRDVPVTALRYTEPGRKVAYWDGRDLQGNRAPSGLYYVELTIGDDIAVTRIIVTAPRRRNRLFPFFRRND